MLEATEEAHPSSENQVPENDGEGSSTSTTTLNYGEWDVVGAGVSEPNPAGEKPPSDKGDLENPSQTNEGESTPEEPSKILEDLLETGAIGDTDFKILQGLFYPPEGSDKQPLGEEERSALGQYSEMVMTQTEMAELADPEKLRADLAEIDRLLKIINGGGEAGEAGETDHIKLENLKAGIAERLNNAFSPEKLEEWTAKILLARNKAVGGFMAYLTTGFQNSDLTRFIDALIMGADYNSSASMSRAYEAEGANQVTVDGFFKQFTDDPDKSLEKMIAIEDDLGKALNWKSDTLKKAANGSKEDKKAALKNYFLEMYQVIAKASGAENLMWSRASSLIAREVFGGGAVINPEVLKELNTISTDERAANGRFDVQNKQPSKN